MQTRIFKSGNSLAVRIPSELALPGGVQEVEIERRGNELIIRPTNTSKLNGLGNRLKAFSTNFMVDGRPHEKEQDREGL